MKNNRGLSLIEMIIVIAIMAVVGAVGLGFMTIQANGKVKECTHKISSSISKVKVDAMSKSRDSSGDDYYLQVGKDSAADGGRYYIIKYTPTSSTKEIIGNKNYTITYTSESGTEYTVSESDPLIIKFERETGGFKKTAPGSEYFKEIKVSNGSKEMKLTIVPITGKVTIE